MNIGPMRSRITIQSPTVGTNPWVPSTSNKWQDVLTTWARIQTADPKVTYNTGSQAMKVTHIVTMRYPGKNYVVSPGYQIVFGTRVFFILPGIVNPDERNKMLILYAFEIGPSQGGLSNGG